MTNTQVVVPSPKQEAPVIRAAEYVRMSTEHQRYSTENQSDAIRQYAEKRGITIVRTFADEGKSGLKITGRDALKQLIREVQTGVADFTAILVYDVSRWGRFQDADESAYYEYVCRSAGIAVHYCAEQFFNDGSPISAIVKGVKRAMAGEYSRELSTKVWAGQSRLVRMGFRQGGPAGYGLRRRLIDERGVSKGDLRPGEQKSIQTDRVILALGPQEEVETVRWIYHSFITEGRRESELAKILNEKGCRSEGGRLWTGTAILHLLTNEKYVGNNVWNRESFKLQQRRVYNPPEMFVRCDGVFEPLVERGAFDAVQAIIKERSRHLSDNEMLDTLKSLLSESGSLSAVSIRRSPKTPCLDLIKKRFGSLRNAYRLIGYVPPRDYSYIQANKELQGQHRNLVAETVAGIVEAGGYIEADPVRRLLTVNGEFTVSILIARCRITAAGYRFWKVRLDARGQADIAIVVRMLSESGERRDYYILPRLDVSGPGIRLGDHNGVSLDRYRFESLNALFSLAARSQVEEVARCLR